MFLIPGYCFDCSVLHEGYMILSILSLLSFYIDMRRKKNKKVSN